MSWFLRSLALVACINSFSLEAKPSFTEYVSALKVEALGKGFDEQLVERAFDNLHYREKVVKADKNQPEKRLTLDTYLATRVPDWKVQQAVALTAEHQVLLEKVEREYGVQKRFIVALWGNESNFGKIMGRHPVMQSLVTLAYEGRREALFKKQLFAALTILQQGHIPLEKFVGSWAGAMGQSQFMPSSFLDYAVDFDNDGKKDIWHNAADVFASIANFLKQEGWQYDLTWGRQVVVSDNFDFSLQGLKSKRLLTEWQALGVRRYNKSALPTRAIHASLIAPDGESGRIYLVYENFHTLMKWNRSSYFGVSVSYLADRIKKGV